MAECPNDNQLDTSVDIHAACPCRFGVVIQEEDGDLSLEVGCHCEAKIQRHMVPEQGGRHPTRVGEDKNASVVLGELMPPLLYPLSEWNSSHKRSDETLQPASLDVDISLTKGAATATQ